MVQSFRNDAGKTDDVLSNAFHSIVPKELRPGYSLGKNSGRNGTAALVYERNNPESYALQSFPLGKLQSDAVYQVEVWVRGENLRPGKDKNLGGICVQFQKGGKYFSGVFPMFGNVTGDEWKKLSMQFSLKAGAESASVLLYLRKGYTGKIFFSDLTVRKAGRTDHAVILNKPDRLTINGSIGTLQFTAGSSSLTDSRLWVTVTNAGRKQELLLRPAKPGGFSTQVSNLSPGAMTVHAKLVDMKSKSIVCEETYQLHCIAEKKPAVAVTFDAHHRLTVQKVPFMPIGIFMGGVSEEDLKKLSASGINTVLPYTSMGLDIAGKGKNQIETLVKSLDLLQKYNMKIIFSLKDQYLGKSHAMMKIDDKQGINEVTAAVVSALRHHPALLAWYTSDEDTRGEVPKLLDMRRRLSILDPWHPVCVLTFRKNDFPYYAVGGDICGVDAYPIENASSRSMQSISELTAAAAASGNPVWAVPQVFNWGVYRAKTQAEFQKYRFPTLEEIRAMTLNGLVHGATGIIFYHYADIFRRAEKFAPGSAQKEWPKVIDVIKDLKQLEPFILSKEPAPELKFEHSHQVEAKAFRDARDRNVVIVCGVGPGKNHAVFTINSAQSLKSKYGHTQKRADGKYEFKGKDIVSDILITE